MTPLRAENKVVRKIVLHKSDNRAMIYLPLDFIREFEPDRLVIVEKRRGGELVIKKLSV